MESESRLFGACSSGSNTGSTAAPKGLAIRGASTRDGTCLSCWTMIRNAALVSGKTSELGTIEQGKNADLVVVRGDPCPDIASPERPLLVIKDGIVVRRNID